MSEQAPTFVFREQRDGKESHRGCSQKRNCAVRFTARRDFSENPSISTAGTGKVAGVISNGTARIGVTKARTEDTRDEAGGRASY